MESSPAMVQKMNGEKDLLRRNMLLQQALLTSVYATASKASAYAIISAANLPEVTAQP